MRHFGLLLIVGPLALGAADSVPAQEKKIEMTMVKYDGLKQEILKHRGKVVIVDFWATNCIPCKEAMPHYVEMQKKYADKGLVIITVSVDPADNRKRVESANKFLNENNVALRNLILDEPPEVWTKRFDSSSLPFSYIFDRQGKWVRLRSLDHPTDYNSMVDKTTLQMLGEK